VIYTALAGSGRDTIVDPIPVPGVDYACFTDQPVKSSVWQIRPFSWTHKEAVRTAKHPKVLPHKYFPRHTLSLWVDANITPGPDIIRVLNIYLREHDLALHRHPRRTCLYKEARVVSEAKKDYPEIINKAILRYSREGLPRNFGLWECGVLFRRHHAPGVVEAMNLWWQEIKIGTQSDQMPFAYALWKTGLPVKTIDGDVRQSPFFSYQDHPPIFWGKVQKSERKREMEPCLSATL